MARYLEQQGPEAIERQLDLIAHHYWHSDDEAKKRLYLRRAGEAAQASYANVAAIDYYERLAPLLPDAERVDVLLELGKVLELVGELDRARAKETEALELAEASGDERARAWCDAALAEVARKQTRYDEAADRLARADAAFSALGDEQGLGQVLHLEGTLAAQRGLYAEARSRYEAEPRDPPPPRRPEDDGERAQQPRRSSPSTAATTSSARSFHEQALELRTELGDRWAIAVSMTNLGMIASTRAAFEEARGRFEEAMRLHREVGDTSMRSRSTRTTSATRYRGLGDYAAARQHYARQPARARERDDRWALAFLLEDVGRLAALTGEPEPALELLGAADALREEIGVPRGPTLEQEIAEAIEPAVSTLADDAREAARTRGRGLRPRSGDRRRALDDRSCLIWCSAVRLVRSVVGSSRFRRPSQLRAFNGVFPWRIGRSDCRPT